MKKLLKTLRTDKGISQKELAEKSGLSIATIQGYEQGKFKPKIGAFIQVFNALGYSYEEIDSRINSYINKQFQEQPLTTDAQDTISRLQKFKHDIAILIAAANVQTYETIADLKADLIARIASERNDAGDAITITHAADGTITVTDTRKDNINAAMDKLNNAGLDELQHHADLLSLIPDFKKEP